METDSRSELTHLRTHPLLIPELVTQVVEYSSKKSNAVNARVCWLWYAIIKPGLWNDIQTRRQLKALLQTLGPWSFSWEKENVRKFPQRPDWQRFLSHAKLVRSLTFESEPRRSLALQFITAMKPQAVSNPFPNLHTLACNGLSNDSWASPSWAPFVHPGLKHLVFKFWYASLPELVPFALPLVNMQGLSRFEITVDSNEAQVRNLVKTIHVIRDLPNLTTLVIPLYAATQDVLQAASELPVLEHLVSDQYGKEVDCRCVYFVIPTFAVGCFPVLTSLTIVGCVTELLTIVQHPHFPINIIALRVYRTYCPQNANNLMGFHEFVAQHCRNLTEYAVTSLFPIVFSFRQLLPLASLQIVDLTVEALKFSQDELQELLTTLPNLKKLNLNHPPFHPKPGSNAGLTMDMIPVIASCCPRLQKLGIHIKDSNIGTSSSMEHIVVVPFNDGFSELHVGNSAPPIHIFFEIVEYLGLILPANCQIKWNFPEGSKPGDHWEVLAKFANSRTTRAELERHFVGGLQFNAHSTYDKM